MAEPIRYSAGFMINDTSGVAKYEVQRTNNFYITLDLSDFGASADLIRLACETTGLPTSSTDPLENPYGNSTVKVAGKTNFDDVTVSVKDFIVEDVEKVLQSWRTAVYNAKTGKVGWASNYKRTASVTLYGPNGERQRTWKLKGVWPTSLDLGEMDYSSSDLRKISMTLSVDEAYLEDRKSWSPSKKKLGTS